jgi:cytochrome c biogenesis protein
VKITKFLTARSTVITLFTTISAALLLASAVPQRVMLEGKPPEWAQRLPEGLRFLSTLLQLDNVVGSAWFAVLVAVFWLSLFFSTISQFGATKALIRRVPAPEPPAGSLPASLPAELLSGRLSSAGYRLAASADGVERYVKNLAGYWGGFLLHIGLVIAVIFSLVYVVTQHRVLVRLVGQEITKLSADSVRQMRGVLPLGSRLPYSVVLKSLEPRFWGNDKLEYLSSELYFTDLAGGDPRRVDVALSDKSRFGSFLVYQANAFGRAFDLELAGQEGTLRQRLFLPYPHQRDKAGYGELSLPGGEYLLKAKFYADAERRSMRLNRPPLTLRLYRGKELVQEATLEPGVPVALGPLGVRLIQSEWWTEILLDGSRGTAGIFAGFAVILAGVLCSYCLVPREVIVWHREDALFLQQVVRRFASFYREEFTELTQPQAKDGAS